MREIQQYYQREEPAGFTRVMKIGPTIENFQPIRIGRIRKKARSNKPVVLFAAMLAFLLLYFLAPLRTNFMVLGIDRAPQGTALGRSDTILLVTVIPLKPYIGMLSIPRDLWVPIENVGENRINTVHFFAEGNQKGSGPKALRDSIKSNFGVSVPYYIRVKFNGVTDVVDAMGGINITLDKPTALYEAGTHHLTGEQALAFVRDRKGADDFSRMAHAQLFVQSAVVQVIRPATWPKLPGVALAMLRVIDTNLPLWQYPRLGFAFVRAIIFRVDSQTFTREMAMPFVTNEGASVLLPNWDLIRPVVKKMFGGW